MAAPALVLDALVASAPAPDALDTSVQTILKNFESLKIGVVQAADLLETAFKQAGLLYESQINPRQASAREWPHVGVPGAYVRRWAGGRYFPHAGVAPTKSADPDVDQEFPYTGAATYVYVILECSPTSCRPACRTTPSCGIRPGLRWVSGPRKSCSGVLPRMCVLGRPRPSGLREGVDKHAPCACVRRCVRT